MPARRPSPVSPVSLAALCVAAVSLVVALATSAWAAGLAPNSVGTKQLKADAVTGAKVKAGSIAADDLSADAVDQPASAFASITRSPGFVLPGTETVMFALTEFADTTTGLIYADGPSRLTVSATATVRFERADQAACRVDVLGPVGWQQASRFSLVTGERFDTATLPVLGSHDTPGGFASARLVCRSVDEGVAIEAGSLAVVSTPR